VSVSFGGLQALLDVGLEVGPGEIVGIIGPNGAGKTTLFDCLSGYLPCEGRAWVGPTEITTLLPHQRAAAGLGRSFQDARLYPTMTVLETLRVATELTVRGGGVLSSALSLPRSRRGEREATKLALELVESFGLGAYRDKLVRELSTGTRRVVDLACVVAQRPSVVLLDEPSSGIAQRETEALGPLLLELRDRTGCALVLIEHDMPLLLGLAERVYALETGTVIAEGPPNEVVHHPEVVRSYLGADPAAINRSGTIASRTRTTTRRPAPKRTSATARTAAAGKPAVKKPAVKKPAVRKPSRG
jgi:branched-chain amino acid transport system ATP-binding protein